MSGAVAEVASRPQYPLAPVLPPVSGLAVKTQLPAPVSAPAGLVPAIHDTKQNARKQQGGVDR